jgi:trigger factor
LTDNFTNIPGLYKEIIGLRKDESKEFKLKLPEDYNIKAVANKEGVFKVKVHDIQEIVLPDLNDEFANRVVPQIQTLELLKKRIKSNMREERVNNAQARFEYKLMDKLIQNSKIEYPPVMIDIETENLINYYKEELQTSNQNSGEYEEKIRAMAKWRILWSLIINEVAKLENIEVKASEIDEEIEKIISEEKEGKEDQHVYLNDEQNQKNIYELLKARKTIKKLVEIVKANA